MSFNYLVLIDEELVNGEFPTMEMAEKAAFEAARQKQSEQGYSEPCFAIEIKKTETVAKFNLEYDWVKS